MDKETTLVLIKPDGITRQLTGKIISRFEDSGLKIIGMKMLWIGKEKASEHYRQDIADKHGNRVREGLIKYINEGPILAIALEGVDAINVSRKIVGSTYPNESPPGTIRGDFAHISKHYANSKKINVRNLIHASANTKDANIEVPIWFSPQELHTYKTVHDMICLEE
jgi:nucleoside-diphosphate kinase